jgi:chaperone protein EcpD
MINHKLLALRLTVFLLMSGGWLYQAHAYIVVNGTRVIYPAQKKEVIVNIENFDQMPSLVQVWIDSGDAQSKPESRQVPFIMSPPLFRLDPGKGQTLRLVYTQEPLPLDRESLFWLNILDIPPSQATNREAPANKLEIAFKHRLKVFFRPPSLIGNASSAPAKINWELIRNENGKRALQANNPTPFHVNFNNVDLVVSGKHYEAKSEMVPPFSSRVFNIPMLSAIPQGEVSVNYTYINDLGGASTGIASISKVTGTSPASQ